jgi:hypothetical protein
MPNFGLPKLAAWPTSLYYLEPYLKTCFVELLYAGGDLHYEDLRLTC